MVSILKFFKWLGSKNTLIKPMSVLVNISAPLGYVLYQTQGFILEEIDSNMVAVSNELVSGLQGSIIMLFIMMSIVQVYKPPKSVIISLILGGLMLFASSLFATLGVSLVLFGLSNLVNKYTLDKLVIRNEAVKKHKQDLEIQRLSEGR